MGALFQCERTLNLLASRLPLSPLPLLIHPRTSERFGTKEEIQSYREIIPRLCCISIILFPNIFSVTLYADTDKRLNQIKSSEGVILFEDNAIFLCIYYSFSLLFHVTFLALWHMFLFLRRAQKSRNDFLLDIRKFLSSIDDVVL